MVKILFLTLVSILLFTTNNQASENDEIMEYICQQLKEGSALIMGEFILCKKKFKKCAVEDLFEYFNRITDEAVRKRKNRRDKAMVMLQAQSFSVIIKNVDKYYNLKKRTDSDSKIIFDYANEVYTHCTFELKSLQKRKEKTGKFYGIWK